jgi:heme-degrading monooxygenase HmoA
LAERSCPRLKKQKGFVDELLLLTPDKKEVVAISLWEKKEDTEIYRRGRYPKIENMMEEFIEGVPVIKNYEAEYSAIHKIAFAAVC